MFTALALAAALLASFVRASGSCEPVAPTRIGSTRLERVGAPVSLKGQASGLVPGRPVPIVMRGLADFQGEGGLASGLTPIAVTAVIDGTPGCETGWVSPSVRVLLLKDGRYVAGAVVEGTLSVRACVQEGAARLEAHGTLAGQALCERP